MNTKNLSYKAMDYQKIISEIYHEVSQMPDTGAVAAYIPELGRVNPTKFGVHFATIDDQHFCMGAAKEKFSIQSIAKVLALVLAYTIEGGNLWNRVGVEPSGTAFNSLIQLEINNGIPRNPLVNPGALVISDVLVSHLEHPKKDLLAFIRKVSNNPTINFASKIVASEKSAGHRNAALVNLMKSYGNIENEVEEVLDFYFHLCSVELTCKELSQTFLFLANSGVNPCTKERFLSISQAKRINAIMQLCGFYDEAGEFAFKVGLPGKSGVGGGIVAIHPNKYSIAVWSPRINEHGNSNKGIRFLELFTSKTASSIF